MSEGLNQQLTERRKQAITSAVGNASMNFIKSATGAKLIDVDGREYIDFGGGIGAMSIGHSHSKVVAAIKWVDGTVIDCVRQVGQ